jgi:hypothetical protein
MVRLAFLREDLTARGLSLPFAKWVSVMTGMQSHLVQFPWISDIKNAARRGASKCVLQVVVTKFSADDPLISESVEDNNPDS